MTGAKLAKGQLEVGSREGGGGGGQDLLGEGDKIGIFG